MPTSKLELIQPIVYLVWQQRQALDRPIRVVDVGPGYGKYGLLIREAADPDALIDAVEPHPVDLRLLRAIYRRVLAVDVQQVAVAVWTYYDLVLLIDVIEHLTERDGRELLSQISAPMLISTPATLFATPEQSPDLPAWEQHRSLWSHHDLVAAVAHRRVTFVENVYDQIVCLVWPDR